MSFLRIGLPLVIAMIGAASACAAGILLTHGVWRVVAVALLAIVAWIVFWFRQSISPKLSVLWGKVKASEKRRDGTVNPFQRGLAVLDEPLAMALVSSALLANEREGVVQLVVAGGVLQAVPTGAATFWPANSLEDRLRRNRRLPVAEIVEDWLASSSDVPYRRAVELAEQGMVTRGLAVLFKAGDNPEAVLTDASTLAATFASTAAWSRRFWQAFCWIPRSRAGATDSRALLPCLHSATAIAGNALSVTPQ